MAYIGNTLRTAQPNYQIIDDISASFNGSTTSFALQVGGVTPAPFPVSAQHCLISVGGVIQQPDPTGTDGFLLSGSNIVFSAAPSAGENFFGVVLAGADYINVGAEFPDGSVANPSITFDSDRDTGLYRKGANNIAIATNGIERVSVGTSEVVFNDGGEDIDFRIEGDTDSNLFFVDAGNNRVGVGTTSPDYALDVALGIGVSEGQAIQWHDGSGSNSAQIYGDAGDNLIFRNTSANTERLRIQSGGGISFNGDTAAANALADYEEGVWEPRFFNNANGATTVSTGSRAAKYVKIGKTVYVTAYIQCSSKGTNTGNVTIDNLPYQADSNGQLHYACSVAFFSGLSVNISTMYGTVQPSSNYILIRKVAGTANNQVDHLLATEINNGFDIVIACSYISLL